MAAGLEKAMSRAPGRHSAARLRPGEPGLKTVDLS